MLLALQREEVADLHRLARIADVELGVPGHRAPMDPEYAELAHEGVDRNLEDVGDGRGVGVRRDLHRLVRGVAERGTVPLPRAGHDLLDHVGELRDPDPRFRRGETHRDEMTLAQRPLERVVEPIRIERLALVQLQVALHQRLVDLDHLIHDAGMGFVHRREVGRPVTGCKEAVHHLRATARGQVDGHALAAEDLGEIREQRLQVELFGVDLVHHHHTGESARGRRLHHAPGDHLDALARIHHHGRRLHRSEHRERAAEKIGVTGGVHEVDMARAVVEVHDRGVQRVLVLLLLRVEVAHRGAAGDRTGSVDDAGECEQRLGQGRLAGTAMPRQSHVADVVGGMGGHERSPPSVVAIGRTGSISSARPRATRGAQTLVAPRRGAGVRGKKREAPRRAAARSVVAVGGEERMAFGGKIPFAAEQTPLHRESEQLALALVPEVDQPVTEPMRKQQGHVGADVQKIA